jgi:hypothetical protein
VHTTQFAIRDPSVGLLEAVLTLARDTSRRWTDRPLVHVAGVVGDTRQATAEAALAARLDYDVALVSLGGLDAWTIPQLVAHLRAVGEILPVMGFYLQPAVGGRDLPYAFWRAALELEPLVAIKVAPFDRYRTLDVVRAVWDAGRGGEVALYTGNDDHILLDLLTPFRFGEGPPLHIVGGLLGQCGPWTRGGGAAHECRTAVAAGTAPPPELLAVAQLTDERGHLRCRAPVRGVPPGNPRSCAARVCWRGRGAWSPPRRSPRARPRGSPACVPPTRT